MIISRIANRQIAVQQLGVGVVRCKLLLLLLLPAPPAIPFVHAEQHGEDHEEERGDARGHQYPHRPGFLGFHFLLDDGRALVVQLVRPIAELHVVTVIVRGRPVRAIDKVRLYVDLAFFQPGVQCLALAMIVKSNGISGQIEHLQGAERCQILGADRGDGIVGYIEFLEGGYEADIRNLRELILRQL